MKVYLLKSLVILSTTLALGYCFFWLSEEYLWDNSVRTLGADAYKVDAYALTRSYYRALCDKVRTSYCQVEFFENKGKSSYSVPGKYFANSSLIPVMKIKNVSLDVYGGDASLVVSIAPSMNTLFKFILLGLFLEFPFLLTILYYKKRNELIESKKITELSRRVAHDIRGPVSALRMALTNTDQRYFLELAIERIEEISHSLVKGSSKLNNKNEKVDIVGLIELLKIEKELEFSHKLKIKIETSGNIKHVIGNQIELKRLFGNLLTNSFEANATSVFIKIRFDDTKVELEIVDNGDGIPLEILKELGKKEITTKVESGNGLGFYWAKKSIEKMNGNIFISSSGVKFGTTVNISLNLASITIDNEKHDLILLLDDEKIIQLSWKRYCQQKNKKLVVFQTKDELISFLKQNVNLDFQTPIYLDYNVDENCSGLEIAKIVHQMGFTNLTLVSGQDFSALEQVELLKYFKKLQGKMATF